MSRGLCTINMKMIVVHNANNKEQRLKYKTCKKYMLDLPLRLGEYEGKGEWGGERSWSVGVVRGGDERMFWVVVAVGDA